MNDVERKEFEQLKREVEQLKRELEQSKNDRDLLADVSRLMVDLLTTDEGRRQKYYETRFSDIREKLKSRNNKPEGGNHVQP